MTISGDGDHRSRRGERSDDGDVWPGGAFLADAQREEQVAGGAHGHQRDKRDRRDGPVQAIAE